MALDHIDDGKRINDFTLYTYKDDSNSFYKWRILYLVGPNKPNSLYDATVDETSYGCAESLDLHEWNILPRAFGTSDNRKLFDGCAIWTMCVLNREEILLSPDFKEAEPDMPFNYRLMYYTGVDANKIQRVGVASYNFIESEKMPKWMRLGQGAIVEADPRYYETTGRMAWRDPYVVYDEDCAYQGQKGCFIMLIAAKDKRYPNDKNGCIAIAKSRNLIDWECEAPLLSPHEFDEMECPVVFKMGGRAYLLSSITDPKRPDDTLRVHYWMADTYTGEYQYMGPLTENCHYAARVIEDGRGHNVLLHTEWEDIADEHDVVHRSRGQRVSDPRIVTQDKDGRLSLSPHAPRPVKKPVYGISPKEFYGAEK